MPFLSLLIACTAWSNALAGEYLTYGSFLGRETLCRVENGDSLYEIARRYDVGLNTITSANPGVDMLIPPTQSLIIIPSQWILPDVPIQSGIVINLAEMRLYFLREDGPHVVATFPVGIGDTGADTPLGTFSVMEKITNPSWYVPREIRRERPELPAVVPPGPNNPMGSRALRLSRRTVLIHGTDRPWGIGSRNSHGCIRLFPEDIDRLFALVLLGTRVTIVDQPVKAAFLASKVFLEVHDYRKGRNLYREALSVLEAKLMMGKVDLEKVRAACRQPTGRLTDVSL